MKKKIVIQIPCLNEETTIGKVVTQLKRNLPSSKIMVYDNLSDDKSAENAKNSGAEVVLEKKKCLLVIVNCNPLTPNVLRS